MVLRSQGKKRTGKSLLLLLPVGVGFRQSNFKSEPKPASTKELQTV